MSTLTAHRFTTPLDAFAVVRDGDQRVAQVRLWSRHGPSSSSERQMITALAEAGWVVTGWRPNPSGWGRIAEVEWQS